MKTKTMKDFEDFTFEEAITKYPDIKTWATGFLLTCHSQAATKWIYKDKYTVMLQNEVDRRFEQFQGESNV